METNSPARLSKRFRNVAAVSAVGSNSRLSSFSNYGREITAAAPGDRIFSLVPGGGFNSDASGTSFAAPYVTGTAGLLLSVQPDFGGIHLNTIIKYTTTDTGFTDPGGNSVRLLNAARATQQAQFGFVVSDIIQFDLPASRLPDSFPADLPLEKPGDPVTSNFVAATNDQFQQTRQFTTSTSFDELFATYHNYFVSHGWTILFDIPGEISGTSLSSRTTSWLPAHVSAISSF